jgi:hypothetical protein
MAHFTKVIGKMIRQTEEDDLFMQMEMFITESGRMIKRMVLEFIITQMAQDTKANGLRTNSTAKVKKSGLIMPAMKVITKKVRSMDTANSFGLMGQLTLVPLSITILKAQASTHGRMGVSLMESGATIRCMEAECLHGSMADVMKENMLMIRSMVMESSHGPMVVSTRDSGKMESNTVLVPTTLAKARLKKDNGLMASVFNGLRMINDSTYV